MFGLLPALQATRPDLVPALKDETSIGGYRRSWLRNGLVVFQVSLSLLLLICAGLVLRGLQRAQLLNPGFVPHHAVEMSFDLSLQGYDGPRCKEFKRNLLERVRALPGVEYAGLSNLVPLTMNMNNNSIFPEGAPQERGANIPTAMTSRASPGFIAALGVQLLEGRDFIERTRGEGSARSGDQRDVCRAILARSIGSRQALQRRKRRRPMDRSRRSNERRQVFQSG